MTELSKSSASRSIDDELAGLRSSIQIMNVSPVIDCGRFSAKRILGDLVTVSADIVRPGHDLVAASLSWRMRGNDLWNSHEMEYSDDEDRWSAKVQLSQLGFFEFFVGAWNDSYSKKIQDIDRWQAAGEDITSDVAELIKLATIAAVNASPDERSLIESRLFEVENIVDSVSENGVNSLIKKLSERTLVSIIRRNLEKRDYVASRVFSIVVDRSAAIYSAWYEMFHRSQGSLEGKSATFKDCENRLEDIKKMGFDVIYLPPIHPIGYTNRRGPNNTKSESQSDPGSPWAIGSDLGGHDTVNPDLGSMKDFLRLVSKSREMEMDVALDLAFQVSPDHPYVKEHPEWFYHRKDGTIKFAENPPKKYYDIYPLNFESKDWNSLWEELRRVVEFWIEKGIKIFRVDNPHTKPFSFWEWSISKARSEYPDVIFLAEAFTRPNAMKLLAKVGFDQSYTYFTWKNTKYELTQFIKEFFLSDVVEYYRPNLFANTPDILPEYLQTGGRPAFKIRAMLAATLSSSYGIYNGFELCENIPLIKGSEEYLNSEKYQYVVRDWNEAGNIKDYISKINRIRRENPALQCNSSLRLLECDEEQILFYGKWTEDLTNVILMAVNLDPFSAHDGIVTVPVRDLGLHGSYTVRDLITEREFVWHGDKNYVRLDPKIEPAHILLLQK
jgi:starch synthase (maltosyl-transferring)